jgi:A/G-specific adenine glycosylase
MPWKGEKNPYKVWLSEIILQQTRVEQGIGYYQRFIANYPTVFALANASEQDVFKLWEGLGYYTRCKNVIATARIIANELNGVFPGTYDEILKLRGVGPYTAAAIASFAFNQPYAVVDGNVQRVISRYFGITTPVGSTQGKELYQQIAQSLLDKSSPDIYNQAIMDFGAVICKPQNPLCEQCPQQSECEAYRHGWVTTLPVKQKKLVKRHRWFYYFLITSNDKIFIRKRTANDIWQNLHEFLLHESTSPEPLAHNDYLNEVFGGQTYSVLSKSRIYVQQLTHQTIHGQFINISAPDVTDLPQSFIKVTKGELSNYAFPKMITSFLQEQQF